MPHSFPLTTDFHCARVFYFLVCILSTLRTEVSIVIVLLEDLKVVVDKE